MIYPDPWLAGPDPHPKAHGGVRVELLWDDVP